MERIYDSLYESGREKNTKISDKVTEKTFGNISLRITNLAENDVDYYTFRLKKDIIGEERLKDNLIKHIDKTLEFFFDKHNVTKRDACLVVGLGNHLVTADSLGSISADSIYASAHLVNELGSKSSSNLAVVKPSVSGLTGLESTKIIKGIVDIFKPKIAIVIDTLSSSVSKNMGRVVQISDKGIVPGSGANNAKTPLNKESLAVPVIAIGVPLVIYINKMITECVISGRVDIPENLQSLVVAPKEIDFYIKEFSSCISKAINNFFSN